MKFQTLAWMTSVVAQGKTTIARAILRPRNWLFSTRARMKPRMVDSATTATVQTRVFFSTMPKALLLRTFAKLAAPLKPLISPALLTSLRAIRNTNTMGTRMKTDIRIKLGAIQTYGSILRKEFFFTGYLPPSLTIH